MVRNRRDSWFRYFLTILNTKISGRVPGVHPRPAKKHQGLAPFEPFRKTKDPMVPWAGILQSREEVAEAAQDQTDATAPGVAGREVQPGFPAQFLPALAHAPGQLRAARRPSAVLDYGITGLLCAVRSSAGVSLHTEGKTKWSTSSSC